MEDAVICKQDVPSNPPGVITIAPPICRDLEETGLEVCARKLLVPLRCIMRSAAAAIAGPMMGEERSWERRET
jgi:hypothetical protein